MMMLSFRLGFAKKIKKIVFRVQFLFSWNPVDVPGVFAVRSPFSISWVALFVDILLTRKKLNFVYLNTFL